MTAVPTIQARVLQTLEDKVKLGFTGPPEVPIHREEVHEQIKAEGQKPAHVHAC